MSNLSAQHPGSRRWAVVEDDGQAGWLYLTEPDIPKPVAHCWLYNRVRYIEPAQIEEYRGAAPPAPRGIARDEGVKNQIVPSLISFRWTRDGHSVACLHAESPLGFIVDAKSPGCGRYLIKSSPWGEPWDQGHYEALFGKPPTC